MSERITQELRDAMNVDREYTMSGDTMSGDVVARMYCIARGTYCIGRDELIDLCDAIDAIHANLERENESLRRELDRVLGESDDVPESKRHVISHATVEVTPHIDWSRMADEVDEFVQIVRGMAGDAE